MNADAHRLLSLLRHRGIGLANALPADFLAAELRCSTREVQGLVVSLIENVWVVGSSSAQPPGYFLCADMQDVEEASGHLISRARSIFRRVSALRRAAEREFGEPALRLFEIEGAS